MTTKAQHTKGPWVIPYKQPGLVATEPSEKSKWGISIATITKHAEIRRNVLIYRAAIARATT
jgi:hypothetical protein